MENSGKFEILGFFAGLLTTFSFIPQIISIWRMAPEPVEDISLLTYVIFNIGIAGWLIYGIKIKKIPVIVWNAVALFLTASIIGYKIIYG